MLGDQITVIGFAISRLLLCLIMIFGGGIAGGFCIKKLIQNPWEREGFSYMITGTCFLIMVGGMALFLGEIGIIPSTPCPPGGNGAGL